MKASLKCSSYLSLKTASGWKKQKQSKKCLLEIHHSSQPVFTGQNISLRKRFPRWSHAHRGNSTFTGHRPILEEGRRLIWHIDTAKSTDIHKNISLGVYLRISCEFTTLALHFFQFKANWSDSPSLGPLAQQSMTSRKKCPHRSNIYWSYLQEVALKSTKISKF